ncbi:MAG: hypothetical protein M3Z36_13600, partial [Acidobacteriota bacterium]|nr:hypothetical protein [Acidobacteriota bacterium]
MHRYILGGLILFWMLWALPFILANWRRSGEKAVTRAPRARWGIALQIIAYALIFRFQTSWT